MVKNKVVVLAAGIIMTAGLSACGSTTPPAAQTTPPAGAHNLVGTFTITAGTCPTTATGTPTGSYLTMKTKADKPFDNSSGGCTTNASYTVLKPGTDGGLVTGSFQTSNGAIFSPATFFGEPFVGSTHPVDPQTKTRVAAPSLTENGGKITGNLAAFSVAYQGANFNQGAPKPNGTLPGNSQAVTGTINCQGDYTIHWASTIVGGSFSGFTGAWTFSGTFKPASGTVAAALGCS
jgi:hypothetical protein